MNRPHQLLLTAILLLSSTVTSAQLSEHVLRPDLARREGKDFTLSPEPETQRILSPGAVMFDVSKPAAAAGAAAGIEATIETQVPAEVEAVAIYSGSVTFSLPRRSLTGLSKPEIVRWEIPQGDQMTSFTLSLRAPAKSPPARLDSVSVRDLATLSARERLHAHSDQPLTFVNAAEPVQNGRIALLLNAPDTLRTLLYNAETAIEVTDGTGATRRESVRLDLPVGGKQPTPSQRIEIAAPPTPGERISLRLLMKERGADVELAACRAELRPFTGPRFEVPSRSIEDFAAIERNGEIGLYALVGDEGLSRGAAGAPLPVDAVWLAIGNGAEWPVNEGVLRSSRTSNWLDGGPTSFSIGGIANSYYAFFTTSGSAGAESLSTALGVNSLRIAPSAKNPVWFPATERDARAPLWRGNAFFDLSGSKMLVGLQRNPGGETFARVLASPWETRWADLGPLPLPGLHPESTWLTSYTEGDRYYLLAGPGPQLFCSQDRLRDWKPVPFEAPAGWEKMQLVRWDGSTWLFGIVRCNGRGVITWRPVKPVENSFEVVETFEFKPTPLRKGRPPIAPPPSLETYVR